MRVSFLPGLTLTKPTVDRLPSTIVLFLCSALLFTSGCGNKEQVQAARGSGGRPPAPVVIAFVEQRDIPVQIRGIGNVEAYQTVLIRSQVNGQIQQIFFKEGEDVREGQPLFRLDKRPFQADLEKANGQMKHDQIGRASCREREDTSVG